MLAWILFATILLATSIRALNLNPFRFGRRQLGQFPASGQVKLKDDSLRQILGQSQAWKRSKLDSDPNYFRQTGNSSNPKYLWIGCSDSRVAPQVITGEEGGRIFAIRNMGNMIMNNDFSTMAAIRYGVTFLNIPHIVVCGHYECGGFRAAVVKMNHGAPMENWIRNMRDIYRMHQKELDAISNPDARHRRLVELNVIEQCINLFKSEIVQQARVECYEQGRDVSPRIHPCIFDPNTGDLIRVKVNFEDYIADISDIYDLYPATS